MLLAGDYPPRHDACVVLLLDWLQNRFLPPDWLMFGDRGDGSHYAWPDAMLGPNGQARPDIVMVDLKRHSASLLELSFSLSTGASSHAFKSNKNAL